MRKYQKYRFPLLAAMPAVGLVLATGLGSSAGAQTSEEPRLFAADSFWNEPLAYNAPLDPSSDLLVASLQEEVQQDIDTSTGPWINTGSYSTPLYTVPENQPMVRVTLDSTSTAPWRYTLETMLERVPIPAGAEPADGNDGHLTIWQPSTDRMWELWKASEQADGWHARWGGAIENVSEDPGHYTADSWPGSSHHWGATATGLPLIGGVMLLEEFEAGAVDHALALNIPRPRAREYSWPAQDTDGTYDNPVRIPEGARFRIDPNLDLDGLSMHPVARMMAEAAQKYGIVVRDKSGGAVSFSAEDHAPLDYNPYQQPNGGYFRGQGPNKFLRDFPWEHLQLLKMSLCTKQSLPCPKPSDQPPPEDPPPTVQSVAPGDGATGVPPSSNVVVTFSEPMDRQATEAAFALVQVGSPVAGGFSWNTASTELTFDPSAPLESGSYQTSVSTAATDAAGNGLADPRSWSFTVADLISPTIQSVAPSDGATGVDPASNVVVTFSEPMDRQATEAAFTLAQSGLPVPGSFSWNGSGTELTFDPSAPLATGSYSASVSPSATDVAGNALAAPRLWSFTVSAPSPTVIAPSATVILAGSRRSGNAAGLGADDDNAFYSVNSTSGTTRMISWYGRFDGVPSSVGSLAVTYSGKNSRTCGQTIALRRFTTSSWVVLDSRSVGTNEIKVSGLTPPGSPSDYVSATGAVQVRVVCKTATGTFFSSGDLLELRR